MKLENFAKYLFNIKMHLTKSLTSLNFRISYKCIASLMLSLYMKSVIHVKIRLNMKINHTLCQMRITQRTGQWKIWNMHIWQFSHSDHYLYSFCLHKTSEIEHNTLTCIFKQWIQWFHKHDSKHFAWKNSSLLFIWIS